MATFSSFYPWVAISCPGAPQPLMDDAIRRGAREFCKITLAVTSDISLAVVATTQDYAPTLTAGTEFISVVNLKRTETDTLTPRSQEYIDAQEDSSGTAIEYCILGTNPLSVRLRPTPSSNETLTLKVALMPTEVATSVDGRLLDWYQEGVVAYAKFWLMNIPEKPWTNPELAKFSFRQFETQTSNVIIRRNQGHAALSTQVEMRPFA